VPYSIFLKNERREEFVIHGKFGISWDKTTAVVGTQIVAVTPEHWSDKHHVVVP
jgi:hypothetical protein